MIVEKNIPEFIEIASRKTENVSPKLSCSLRMESYTIGDHYRLLSDY